MINPKTITIVLLTTFVLAGVVYAFTTLPWSKRANAPTPMPVVANMPEVNKKSCERAEIISTKISREFYKDGGDFEATPQITASTDLKNNRANIVVIGPVLGSMDSPHIKTDLICTSKGFQVVAAITRSTEYQGAAAKNVLWHPKIALEVSLHDPEVLFEAKWDMVSTTGTHLDDAQTLPYPVQKYPINLTKSLH
jgi:hypothetical protein